MVLDKEKALTAFVEILISPTLLPPTCIPLPKTLVLPPPMKEKEDMQRAEVWAAVRLSPSPFEI